MQLYQKRQKRIRRHKRLRAKIFGTKDRPRLSIFRSSKRMYLQLIDDGAGKTLLSASTGEAKGIKGKESQAKTVGKILSEKALALGIKQIVFDRGGYKYHGRVKAVADAAREAGLIF